MPLHFGIPSLDELLEIPHTVKEHRTAATSLAILGPDGSGKSVLALHMASAYIADCRRLLHYPGVQMDPGHPENNEDLLPKVIYISSDLSYESASTVWDNFNLSEPLNRQIPFEQPWESICRLGKPYLDPNTSANFADWHRKTKLRKYFPGSMVSPLEDKNGISSFLDKKVGVGGEPDDDDKKEMIVNLAFLDLAAYTAGDDWSFTNSLIGQLTSCPLPTIEYPKMPGEDKAHRFTLKHLVVIDSVAGFETFVGRLDAHGVEQSRRSRIAQCMRNAGEHCHIVFVVEEPKDLERLPEEYVTDAVIRLRVRNRGGRVQRTVEVEKARARVHSIGEHPFEIRNEIGTSTGEWENPDTPRAKNSYVQVLHTIAHRYSLAALDPGRGKASASDRVAPFGLPYLDDLFPEGKRMDSGNPDSSGIRCGKVSAILGDSSTGKSVLAEKLLADGFKTLVENWIHLFAALTIPNSLAQKSSGIWIRVGQALATNVLHGDPPEDNRDFPIDVNTSLSKCCERGYELAAGELNAKMTEVAQLNGYSKRSLPVKWKAAFLSRKNRITRLTTFRPEPVKEVLTGKDGFKALSRRNMLKPPSPSAFNLKWGETSEDDAVAQLRSVFSHPNLRYPGVLLTTSDKQSNEVARRCLTYLEEPIRTAAKDLFPEKDQWAAIYASHIEKELAKLIEGQLITRRFDVDNVSSAHIYSIVHRNLFEAQEMIFTTYLPVRQRDRASKSNRIQLIIDDLRVLCNMCPDLEQDSLFLPFLTFVLEREGITSLMIYTDAVRPDKRPEDGISRSLISLVSQGLFLWNVPFEGRNRVALSVVPPKSAERNGLVRELNLTYHSAKGVCRVQGERTVIPTVTPRFELYSGIEEGKPMRIPLAVYLFDEASRFQAYVSQENALWRELFISHIPADPTDNTTVLFALDAVRYGALRDYSHLPGDTQDGHSVVLQVDGYWSQKADGPLDAFNNYLFDEQAKDEETRRHEDPFKLFQGTPLCLPVKDGKESGQPYRRIDYFRNKHYVSRLRLDKDCNSGHIQVPRAPSDIRDRVPFMWDFGFLLVRSGPWRLAAKSEVPYEKLPTSGPLHDVTVDRVLAALGSPSNIVLDDTEVKRLSSWRFFFGACKEVASKYTAATGTAVIPFDIALTSPESFNCLFLEMWLSELDSVGGTDWEAARQKVTNSCYSTKQTDRVKLLELFGEGATYGPLSKWREKSLGKLNAINDSDATTKVADINREFAELKLPGVIAAYRTWLLLLEVIDFSSFCDANDSFTLVMSKEASPQAVASRHWYKTACDYSNKIVNDQGVHDAMSFLRLPGAFSTRGDWFLSSPKSSRSPLLSRYAIDLLSSRRGNLTRMQMGLGLPVRDVVSDDQCGKLRTALRCENGESLGHVEYGELVTRCGSGGGKNEKISWLWRPSIEDYDRQSRALHKWIARLAHWTIKYRREHERGWVGGFPAYDALKYGDASRIVPFKSLEEFGAHFDLLIAELKAAERKE